VVGDHLLLIEAAAGLAKHLMFFSK
jgi:hypothetical protein